MLKKEITVQSLATIEPRPAAMLVQIASQFEASIYMDQNNRHINAKSIMGMMTLALAPGQHINVTTDGTDEKEAMEKLESFLCR